MDDHQRKIELQSLGDLNYLIDNINKAAQQKLDLHLPPSAAQGKDDAFRLQAEELVRQVSASKLQRAQYETAKECCCGQYVHQTLTLALPSLTVNGLDASPSILAPGDSATENDPSVIDPNDPTYEPYDTRLAQKLRDLYASLEEETTRVAELRREAPAKAAANYVKRLKEEMEENDRALAALQAELNNDISGGLDGVGLQRSDVQESWAKGKQGLEALRNVTKVKADLERAVKAVAEVEMG